MQDQRAIFLLTFMAALAIPVSYSFNIETNNPSVYPGEKQDFFGYKVLQFMSGSDKGIIVTAPLNLNGSGEVCKHDLSRSDNVSQCFSPKNISFKNQTIPVKHFGLAIAANSTGSDFTVCSPSVAHECDQNSYLNSVCYKLGSDFKIVSSSKPAFQECTKKTVDLVFLFDGSGSMTEAEFDKNKEFIEEIINTLKNSSIKFAAVQFSSDFRKVFDFIEYEAGTALEKLQREPQMKSLTNTHRALRFVLENILENPGAGASSDATKVLVMITDGDPSDTDRYGTIKEYNAKHIIRFVIGVKVATLDKFKDIASQPTETYAFKIENYDGLTGILENFQKKIFDMEGSRGGRAENMTYQMSQSGFSAVIYNDSLILGSVGSNNRRGSIEEIHQNETQITDPSMEEESYMGYSVSVGKKDADLLYFAGAPRFGHIGQVVLFKQEGTKWTPAQRLNGDQIGSYFGAELCSVDLDSNGNTDFLLVGAPQFYHAQEKAEGKIYVFKLTDEVKLIYELNVTVPSRGRFGTTISSIADLNGDGLRDVAVGAPLEDDNRGAVYIYLGKKDEGIRSNFSQRIMGQNLEGGLRFFGLAIDGSFDMGDDGLPDIVIGSQGTAVILRSKPVFNVKPELYFQPGEISKDKIDCPGNNDEILPMVNLTVCFEIKEATKSKAGSKTSGLNISYTLDIDPMRQTYRGFFSQTDRKTRNIMSVHEMRNNEKPCFNHTIHMPKCVQDTLSPVCIKLNFTQADSENANAVLNVDSTTQSVVDIPFEKRCRKNDTCIAELAVDFNFLSSTLLVAEDNYFNISVELSNQGDESYNTSLTMQYPAGLSFSKMDLIKATRPTLHSCNDLEGVLNKTVCGVSLPVYRSKSATFKTSFMIYKPDDMYEWNDSAWITVIGQSDNSNVTTMTKEILVQFEIKLEVTKTQDKAYLNFTNEVSAPKRLVITYEVSNPGWKSFPVDVSLVFTSALANNFEMNNYQVLVNTNKTQCDEVKLHTCSPEKSIKIIKCNNFTLEKESTTKFELVGDVHFKDLKQRAENLAFLKRYTGEDGEVNFKSLIYVSYDTKRYVLDPHKQMNVGFPQNLSEVCQGKVSGPTVKWSEVRAEFIIPLDRRLIILTGVGLGLLLFIILTVVMFKMGCFKRKKLPEETDSDGEPEQPSEDNKLLDNNEANGSNPESGPEKE